MGETHRTQTITYINGGYNGQGGQQRSRRSRRSDEEVTHELSGEWLRLTVQWVKVEADSTADFQDPSRAQGREQRGQCTSGEVGRGQTSGPGVMFKPMVLSLEERGIGKVVLGCGGGVRRRLGRCDQICILERRDKRDVGRAGRRPLQQAEGPREVLKETRR